MTTTYIELKHRYFVSLKVRSITLDENNMLEFKAELRYAHDNTVSSTGLSTECRTYEVGLQKLRDLAKRFLVELDIPIE